MTDYPDPHWRVRYALGVTASDVQWTEVDATLTIRRRHGDFEVIATYSDGSYSRGVDVDLARAFAHLGSKVGRDLDEIEAEAVNGYDRHPDDDELEGRQA